MMHVRSHASALALAIAASFALAGCGSDNSAPPDAASTEATIAPEPVVEESTPVAKEVAPVDAFLERIAQHCGHAFEGRIIANTPPDGDAPIADDPFVGKTLVMHVRECNAGEIKIPFHVGDDHSRTWVLTRTETGLRLKHDHRHEDGSHDAVTMYGGDTAQPGSQSRQEFPVDDESIKVFQSEGLGVSVTNTWAMEIEPNQRFLYELSRPTGRLFQVEFDLTRSVDTPPTPWGHE